MGVKVEVVSVDEVAMMTAAAACLAGRVARGAFGCCGGQQVDRGAVSSPLRGRARPQKGPAHWEHPSCRGRSVGRGGRWWKRHRGGWKLGRRRQRRRGRRPCQGQRQRTRAAQAAKPWVWLCLRRMQCRILGERQCWGLRAAVAVHMEQRRQWDVHPSWEDGHKLRESRQGGWQLGHSLPLQLLQDGLPDFTLRMHREAVRLEG